MERKLRTVGALKLESNQGLSERLRLDSNSVRDMMTRGPAPYYQDPETGELFYEERVGDAMSTELTRLIASGEQLPDLDPDAKARGANKANPLMRRLRLRLEKRGLWTIEQLIARRLTHTVRGRHVDPMPWPGDEDDGGLFAEQALEAVDQPSASVSTSTSTPCGCGSLTIEALVAANLSRVEHWHSLESWSPLEWAGAMCGEAGEAANFAKKLKRLATDVPNIDGRLSREQQTPEQKDALKKLYASAIASEVADTIIYGVLLVTAAARIAGLDVNLAEVIRDVFNAKSEEYGFSERL